MNDNIKKMLERQDCWQKARKAESWLEKLAKSAAARKSLIAYPGHKLKQFTGADESTSLPDKNPTTK